MQSKLANIPGMPRAALDFACFAKSSVLEARKNFELYSWTTALQNSTSDSSIPILFVQLLKCYTQNQIKIFNFTSDGLGQPKVLVMGVCRGTVGQHAHRKRNLLLWRRAEGLLGIATLAKLWQSTDIGHETAKDITRNAKSNAHNISVCQ